jgi:integrase
VLNIYRRHRKECSKFGSRSEHCPSKPKCAIHVEGIDGQGRNLKPRALKDPASGSGVRDWNRAVEIVRDMELPTPVEPVQKPKTALTVAIEAFLTLKAKKQPETQRKYRNLLKRLQEFAETTLRKSTVDELTYPDMVAFRHTWQNANSTQINAQTMLKAFFAFCVDADYITKNPAKKLDAIGEDREKTEPFEPDEIRRIIETLPLLTDEYGRRGGSIARQTTAFVYVMRYTGMSIGDTTTLEKQHVTGCRIRTYRKKTGEDVYAFVPQFVIDSLHAAPHDSGRYFFWSGEGSAHSRTNKWGVRLQRLFVLADVKVREVEKKRRSGGKLKDIEETVKVSEAKPHMFRHTLARDLLERGVPMEELAEVLGNTARIVEKYYSKWDSRRQARLEQHLTQFWADDAVTKTLAQ